MSRRVRQLGTAALLGLAPAAIALGVGEVFAAFVRPESSPVIAVGNRFILLTPEPLKRWAIRTFGTGDKHALLTGIYVLLAVFALGVGLLALRRLRYGLIGIGVFGAVGAYCALSANAHRTSDVVPTLAGTAVALVVMTVLHRAVVQPAQDADPAPGSVVANRRQFLQVGAAAGGLAVATGLGGRAEQHHRYDAAAARAQVTLPAAVDARPPPPSTRYDLGRSPVPFQTPAADFYRIDTALTVPQIDPAKWRLRIHGRVDRELNLSFADLLERPLIERWITLACVSNEIGGDLISNALFRGVALADLLREAGVHADADQLVSRSSDGMTIGSPTEIVMDGRDAMLAVGMNGAPLPVEHGFPVRMVVPGLYGYVSACKWIVDIEATTFAASVPYWVERGWAQQGPVKLNARIDLPRSRQVLPLGKPAMIAGIAWDQHIGVSAVEVSIDGGEWTSARLAAVPSKDTWRQWVLPWTPAGAGQHVISVRAVNGDGDKQDETPQDVFPSGATGLHRIVVTAR